MNASELTLKIDEINAEKKRLKERISSIREMERAMEKELSDLYCKILSDDFRFKYFESTNVGYYFKDVANRYKGKNSDLSDEISELNDHLYKFDVYKLRAEELIRIYNLLTDIHTDKYESDIIADFDIKELREKIKNSTSVQEMVEEFNNTVYTQNVKHLKNENQSINSIIDELRHLVIDKFVAPGYVDNGFINTVKTLYALIDLGLYKDNGERKHFWCLHKKYNFERIRCDGEITECEEKIKNLDKESDALKTANRCSDEKEKTSTEVKSFPVIVSILLSLVSTAEFYIIFILSRLILDPLLAIATRIPILKYMLTERFFLYKGNAYIFAIILSSVLGYFAIKYTLKRLIKNPKMHILLFTGIVIIVLNGVSLIFNFIYDNPKDFIFANISNILVGIKLIFLSRNKRFV